MNEVTGADERIHAVEDDSDRWADAHTFTVWEPTAGLFLLVRMAVLPNVPAATAGVLAWRGAKPEYAYGHALDEAPLGDWDDLAIAALRIEELESLTSWEVNLADGDNGLSLRWDAVSAAVPYATPPAFAAGHYEQTCRVTGSVAVNGRTVAVDATGQREHTWGARDPSALAGGWHAVTGFLGAGERLDDRAFDVLVVGDGGLAQGYVHDNGTDDRVVTVDRTTTEGDDGVPQTVDLVLHVAGGRRFEVTGTAHGAPITVAAAPGGGAIVHHQPMRFSSDDGLEGYGVYERMVLP